MTVTATTLGNRYDADARTGPAGTPALQGSPTSSPSPPRSRLSCCSVRSSTTPATSSTGGADTQIGIACLLDTVNAIACIATAVAVFPVVRRQNESLALGFVTSRLMEAAVIVIGIVSLLAVRDAATGRRRHAGGRRRVALQTTGQALVAVRDWTFVFGPNVCAGINALLFGTLLYRSRLVPRIIPTLGLIGAPLLPRRERPRRSSASSRSAPSGSRASSRSRPGRSPSAATWPSGIPPVAAHRRQPPDPTITPSAWRPHDHRPIRDAAGTARFTAVDDVTFTAEPGQRHRLPRTQRRRQVDDDAHRRRTHHARQRAPPTSSAGASPTCPTPVARSASCSTPRRSTPVAPGREILTLAVRIMGLPGSRVDDMLDLVGLTDEEAGRRIRDYSLGMRQRLGIAHALLGDPQVLILDEPANGLDPAGIRWMRDLLRGHADRGGTVLLSSHLLHEIEVVADHLVVIGNGRIVADGTKQRPARRRRHAGAHHRPRRASPPPSDGPRSPSPATTDGAAPGQRPRCCASTPTRPRSGSSPSRPASRSSSCARPVATGSRRCSSSSPPTPSATSPPPPITTGAAA